MRRGSFLRRHVRLARVSAKVRRERPEFARVYELVDARSGGRCEVGWWVEVMNAMRTLVPRIYSRCTARAGEHHHTRKPRRAAANHRPEFIIHLCRRHHDQCSASYRVGRLVITPAGDGTFACQVVQKEGKWAP